MLKASWPDAAAAASAAAHKLRNRCAQPLVQQLLTSSSLWRLLDLASFQLMLHGPLH